MDNALTTTQQTSALATKDLVQEWLEHERLRGQSPKTLQAYERGLDVYLSWLQETGISDPTPRDVRQFKDDLLQEYAPQTVNLRLSAVRSFYRFLVTTDRIVSNPAADVRGAKRSKSKRHKRNELTSAEVRAVLGTCDPIDAVGLRDLAILTLMSYCGLRTVEIYRADIENLKTESDRMVLEIRGKGRAEADEIVVIPRNQEAVIREWLSYRQGISKAGPLFVSLSNRSHGTRLSTRAIRGMVKERYQMAGVVGDGKTTHSLRHSAITSAIRGGAEPLQVQAMARHQSFDTTLNYIHEVNRIEAPAEDLISY
jgi:site-specific recombinase XerD